MGGESNVVPIQTAGIEEYPEGRAVVQTGGMERGEPVSGTFWDSFWTLYPRHEAKKDARKAWDRLSAPEQIQAIVAIADWRRVWQDQNRDVTVIPLPATWLRGERWEDEVPRQYRPGLKKLNGEERPEPAKALEIPQYVKDQIAKLRGRV